MTYRWDNSAFTCINPQQYVAQDWWHLSTVRKARIFIQQDYKVYCWWFLSNNSNLMLKERSYPTVNPASLPSTIFDRRSNNYPRCRPSSYWDWNSTKKIDAMSKCSNIQLRSGPLMGHRMMFGLMRRGCQLALKLHFLIWIELIQIWGIWVFKLALWNHMRTFPIVYDYPGPMSRYFIISLRRRLESIQSQSRCNATFIDTQEIGISLAF